MNAEPRVVQFNSIRESEPASRNSRPFVWHSIQMKKDAAVHRQRSSRCRVRVILFLTLAGSYGVQAARAQEEPDPASSSVVIQAEYGIPAANGAARAYLAAGLYPVVDALAEGRAGGTVSSAASSAPLPIGTGAHALAGRTASFHYGTRGGTSASAPNRFVAAGNRYSAASNAALVALYVATDGDNWTNNTNWDINANPTPGELNDWYGVTVSQGEVSRLIMQDNNLVGTLPAELGDLSGLVKLSLFMNLISGPIPRELGNLSKLEALHLHNNDLISGEIPKELANLSRLRILDLFDNSLTGAIPPELGNLSQLNWLELGSNELSGQIPSELGNLSQLMYLRIQGNSFTGEIPKELGNLTQLRDLWLSRNSLTGEIPMELGNLVQLSDWLLLNDNSLTGEIPKELGNLTRLGRLSLGRNFLTGKIPPELGNLFELGSLHLNDNALSGEIPPVLGSLPQLGYLNLGNNSLTGQIPRELGNLSKLKGLHLEGNSLSGKIPPELGDLRHLELLWLHDNAFTGTLPRSLMQLDSLSYLYFGGQALCAPSDEAFQAWLSGIQNVRGPTCAAVQFADNVENQTFTVGRPAASLVLPEAAGGVTTLTYALEPSLPSGLVFDDPTRTVSGTPTAVTPVTSYTYTASDDAGSSASLTFTIEVVAAVAFQDVIADQSFPRAQPITPLVFPEATGGVPPIEYQLTPSLPAGLDFDAAIRILTGTPTEVTSGAQPYTYMATGANGSTGSLQFALEVYSPVATEREAFPESFAVRGNYPNPFHQSTRLLFDLPWPASVTVEVLDFTGRRVHVVPPATFAAGWEQSIFLSGRAMSSGPYIYRLKAASPEGTLVHVGRLVRVR